MTLPPLHPPPVPPPPPPAYAPTLPYTYAFTLPGCVFTLRGSNLTRSRIQASVLREITTSWKSMLNQTHPYALFRCQCLKLWAGSSQKMQVSMTTYRDGCSWTVSCQDSFVQTCLIGQHLNLASPATANKCQKLLMTCRLCNKVMPDLVRILL